MNNSAILVTENGEEFLMLLHFIPGNGSGIQLRKGSDFRKSCAHHSAPKLRNKMCNVSTILE